MPEKGTDEMVQLLHSTIIEAVTDLGVKFSNGDIMTACTYILVEAGLNEDSPEKLISDITDVVKRIISSGEARGMTKQ